MRKRALFPLVGLLFWIALAALPAKAALNDEEFAGLCKRGSAAQVREAVIEGADTGARTTGEGWTGLMLAARYNPDADVVAELVKAGVKVNAEANGVTALMLSARNPNPSVTAVLLKAGADAGAKDASGWTALMYAAKFGKSAENL